MANIMNCKVSLSLLAGSVLLFSFLIESAVAHGGAADGDVDEAMVNLRARSLILVKIYCLIIIFFATFLPGLSPYFFRWNYGFLVLGIQFAGGVFLATAMLHFLSDANGTFQSHTDKTYPFAYMLACSGYLITAVADVIIQSIYSRQSVNTRTSDAETGKESANSGVVGRDDHEAGHMVQATLIHSASLGDAVLLIIALCFHSVFEGIAIGVAATKADAWRSLWTISLHKVFAAIAMGIALLRILPNRPFLSCAAYAFAFAISSPVGIAIGIIIDSTTQGNTADWIYAISMGFASGVFIYVAINHLLAKGFIPPNNEQVAVDTPVFKLLAFALGLGVLFVVMIWD
ncbi:hypothetical protein Mapa_006377 [Marchantia paleacea]|nr:hypothetical protein Mapa_006377 [Marchantia paleacea]